VFLQFIEYNSFFVDNKVLFICVFKVLSSSIVKLVHSLIAISLPFMIKKHIVILVLFVSSFCSYGQLSDVHYFPPLKQGGNNQAIKQQAFYLSTPEATAFDVDVFQGTNAVAVATLTISNATPGKYNVGDGDNKYYIGDKYQYR